LVVIIYNAEVMWCWVLFTKFYFVRVLLYISVVVSLSLFVCLLYVRWSYDVCVIWEQMILQMILPWSRLTREIGELEIYVHFFLLSC